MPYELGLVDAGAGGDPRLRLPGESRAGLRDSVHRTMLPCSIEPCSYNLKYMMSPLSESLLGPSMNAGLTCCPEAISA